jgi:hypothetical protein
VGVQEHLHQACAVLQGVTQVPSTTMTRLDDVAQGNRLSRSFRTNGPTEKALVMKETDFGHIPWVIAHAHGFPHVGRQREIEVAQALEMHAIGTHRATFRHGQSQQIELVKTLGEPRQKAAAFPARLRWLPRLTMGLLMILIQDKTL